MSEQIQELINKIKTEGFKEAQSQAQEMIVKAQAEADAIIEKAKSDAQKYVIDAKLEVEKMESASKNALVQASRDVLLNLRKEINAILKALVTNDVKEALTAEALADCISSAIKGFFDTKQEAQGIKVILSAEQLAALKNGFLNKLKDEIKQGLEFESSDSIDRGFMISFDQGASLFDFTDTSLAAQLCIYLNTQVSQIVKQSITSK